MDSLYRLAANVTEVTDPRAPNARAYATDASGRVVGMDLRWQSNPNTTWQLVQAVLIDENQAMGNTVAIYSAIDQNGLETPVNCYLYWPDAQPGAQHALPGNPDRKHTITSTFPADGRIGPLGLYIGQADASVDSDLVYGLGLPNAHHVSFAVTWRKRGTTPTPEPEPEPDPDETTHDYTLVLGRIADTLERLAGHLGA